MFDKMLSDKFTGLINGSQEWRAWTFEQLVKDFQMAGVPVEAIGPPYDLSRMKGVVTNAIERAKSNAHLWNNLNYRIDLPEQMDLDALALSELTDLYLLRSFQKVWFRKQISKPDTNHSNESSQKDLKH